MNKEFCNCYTHCELECVDCPFDEDIFESEKNRSVSRHRHLASVKAKEASLDVVDILSSKADRIPDSSKNSKKIDRANRRVNNAFKTSMRYKKQVAEREQRQSNS